MGPRVGHSCRARAGAAQAVAKAVGEWQAAHAARIVEAERQAQVAELEARALGSLRGVAYLGGYVPESAITPGWLYDVLFLEDCLVVLAHRQANVLAEVPYAQVEDVAIGGPGLVKTGGGFVGGGFGMGGAVEGMAIAAVLNALTTRTSVKTMVQMPGTVLRTVPAPHQAGSCAAPDRYVAAACRYPVYAGNAGDRGR